MGMLRLGWVVMIEEYESHTSRIYRVICHADWPASDRGCSGSGPMGSSPSEAADLAIEAGWELIGECWVCPAHTGE
jgi:hypothetical protein